MITHSLKGQSGSQMINEQWPLTFDLWGRTLSARATGWAVSPGWADLDTSSSLCHRPRRSYFFRCPITTLPTKVLPYTSLPSFFEPFVLQHIFNGKFLSITKTAHIRLLQPPYVHRWDVLMEPSGLGQNTALFFGLHPIILKNGPMSDWPNGKSLLFFPCGVHLCASGISVSFPTAICVNNPSLYLSHIGCDFLPPTVH